MDSFLHWFGVLHLVAYAIAGFLFALTLFINWLVRQLRIKKDVLIAFNEYLKKKRADRPFHGA